MLHCILFLSWLTTGSFADQHALTTYPPDSAGAFSDSRLLTRNPLARQVVMLKNKQLAGAPIIPQRGITTLFLVVGPSSAYPFGREIDTLRTIYAVTEALSDSANRYKQTIWPRVSMHMGLLIRYQLTDRIGLTSGCFYAQRGFSQIATYTYRDPVYRYDTQLHNTIHHRIDVVDIPLGVDFLLGRRFYVGLGASLSAAVFKKNIKKIVVTRYTVTVNGKTDFDESGPKEKEIFSLREVTRKLTPSAQVSIGYAFSDKWHLRLNGQATANLFNTGSQVKNAVLNIGLMDKFYPFRAK